MCPYVIHQTGPFSYVDEGPGDSGPAIVLLHGMLGALENWNGTIGALAGAGYRVLAPILPVYDLSLKQSCLPGLVDYVDRFLERLSPGPVVLVGNSLGGHVALLYALARPRALRALVLSGASGIYEVELGTSTMRRRDRAFIRERAALTFYDPRHVTDHLVETVFGIINDRGKALRLIRMARSVQAECVTERLGEIRVPTLLIWGEDDQITPPDVAHRFREHLPRATLRFLPRCGHAPMIEHPGPFNAHLLAFLHEHALAVETEDVEAR